jgi:hypothetical protein
MQRFRTGAGIMKPKKKEWFRGITNVTDQEEDRLTDKDNISDLNRKLRQTIYAGTHNASQSSL